MSRDQETLRLVCDIEVSDIARFKELVEECVAITRDEPGTLLYDWYIDEERGAARLYEAYESLDALRTHSAGRVFTEVGPKMLEVCRFIKIDAYGDFAEMQGQRSFAPMVWWGPAFCGLTKGATTP
jgi:quinol monooxygenase YgiN